MLLAGIVKLTVRPPGANWTFGSEPRVPSVVIVSVPVRSAAYPCDNVRLTLDCEAGEALPLGPERVYDGSAGGAVPEPTNGIEVVFTTRVPFEIPSTDGVKVMVTGKESPGARVFGDAETVKGPFVGVVPMIEMVAGSEPELVMVRTTCSDLPTEMELNRTAPPVAGFTGVFTPPEV